MIVVYTHQEPPKTIGASIFLVGPSPRSPQVASWRPQALDMLASAGFDGVVFVPEPAPGEDADKVYRHRWAEAVGWESRCLQLSDVILAWVPRDLATMPGFTTNVELGDWFESGKVVLGSPPDAHGNRYIERRATDLGVPVLDSLPDAVAAALDLLGPPTARSDGEREVPLMVWRTPHFQSWYARQRAQGNTLLGAQVAWTFRVGPGGRKVFFFALHVSVHIAAENRVKDNEVVLSRPDISAVVLFRRGVTLDDSEVVLVREFRSTVSNAGGFVWEVPGGSSPKGDEAPAEVAAHECEEETGLHLDPSRFFAVGSRQLAATTSAHHAYVMAAELTGREMTALRAEAATGVFHGVEADTERTYVEVVSVADIRDAELVDWSNLGMILHVLADSSRGRRDQVRPAALDVTALCSAEAVGGLDDLLVSELI